MSRKRKHTRLTKKNSPESYRQRDYRKYIDAGQLVSSYVSVAETDLYILATGQVEQPAGDSVRRYRNQLENYIASHPEFLTSLIPLAMDQLAPPLIKEMLKAGDAAQVGPMAAVAGAIAEFVGKDLLATGEEEVMVENGGDIFLCRKMECLVSIFAGQSPLSHKVGIRIPKADMPLGICTSSGTVGHSLSLGRSDSVTVISASVCLADAAATRVGNEVSQGNDISNALEVAKKIPSVSGVVIILDKQLGAWGEVDLVNLD